MWIIQCVPSSKIKLYILFDKNIPASYIIVSSRKNKHRGDLATHLRNVPPRNAIQHNNLTIRYG